MHCGLGLGVQRRHMTRAEYWPRPFQKGPRREQRSLNGEGGGGHKRQVNMPRGGWGGGGVKSPQRGC